MSWIGDDFMEIMVSCLYVFMQKGTQTIPKFELGQPVPVFAPISVIAPTHSGGLSLEIIHYQFPLQMHISIVVLTTEPNEHRGPMLTYVC